MIDLLCIGELLIDFCSLEIDVRIEDASGFAKAPGGAPANVAVAARRLGCSCGFIGAVGDDPFGTSLTAMLGREGVDVSHMVRRSGKSTPLAFAAVHSDGANDFFFVHDEQGLAPLSESDIDASYIRSAGALHFGSISRIAPAARAATDRARGLAADSGLLVSYDPNYRPRLWHLPEEEIRRTIGQGFTGSQIVKVSREEWAFCVGTDDFAAGARRLLDGGAELVIRSEGGQGASYATASGQGHVEAFHVASIEFTGAGDAFVACTISEILKLRRQGLAIRQIQRIDLERILTRANAVGALTTLKRGAIPALPTATQVDAFLRQAQQP